MKKDIAIIVLLFFVCITMQAQTPSVIIKPDPDTGNTTYIVTGPEVLTASQSITLKPGTWIKSGSVFTASITPDAYLPIKLSNENYIFKRSYQKEITNSSDIKKNSDVIESISYFDGLGRPMQNIAIKASPGLQDIVTHIGYDDFGRQDKDYLPYLASTGSSASYRSGADTSTKSYYSSNYSADINSQDPNPFSKKGYENSPLSRVLLQAAPGSAWAINSGHEIKMDYQANVANEVKLFTVTTTWNPSLDRFDIALGNTSGAIFYQTGQLYKNVTKNENWTAGNNNTTEEFKDKEGRIILKKTYGYSMVNASPVNNAPHETYYIYDIYGNLTYVLPPKADGAITEEVLNNLCYCYRYDDRNRLIEKKIPGKEWEYIVYDKLDRPILTQDANLRALNKWIFTKYDAFSRPVYTGEYVNGLQTTRPLVQALANGNTTLLENRQAISSTILNTSVNYSNNAFPTTAIDLFTINYYDDYNNIDLDGGTFTDSYGISPANAKGLATCSKVRILGTTKWTTNVNYYDAKGRSIYNYSKNNFLLSTTTTKNQLDFVGKILETTTAHKKNTDPLITIVDVNSYDHAGRLLTQKQTINNQSQEVLVSNTYDNLGQLTTKGVGGKITQSRLQNITYNYNIRGWLKNINDVNTIGSSLFAFQINYNTPNAGTPLYNGNISQTFWRSSNSDNSLKGYTYTYDDLNRLTEAKDVSAGNPGRYNENLNYDKNGNITALVRLGHRNPNATAFGYMDILTYSYTGNKLDKVEEDPAGSTEGFKNGANLPVEYTYDANGNMKTDANKGITAISYNHLNLPTSISIGGGIINYTYDATGIKQNRTVSTGGSTEYVGNFVYENNELKQFSQPEGYVTYNSGIYNYIYQYKDHLGNNRLSYQDKDNSGTVNSAEIVQENNYYAFGLLQKGYNIAINGVDNKYKYNGKELQDELGLNFYDYGARNYDPALGRWFSVDPMAEISRRFSPYCYAMNNPVFFIDPDGMIVEPGSQKEWDKQKQNVTDQRDRLQTKVDKLTAKATDKGWSAEKLAGKIGNMNDRIGSMNGSLATLGTLEKSSQSYALKTGAGEEGGTTYDSSTGNIVFNFSSTANFVHETAHGGQFENGEIAFSKVKGGSLGQDVGDETAAYKAQFGYDPASVSGLTSSSSASSFNNITPAWVQGITKSDGSKPYSQGGSAMTGISPVNMNTNRDGLIKAYPSAAGALGGLPSTTTLKDDKNTLYKK